MLATARPLGGPSPAAAQTVLWVFVAALLADRAIGGRTPWQPSGSDRGTFWLIQAGQLLALVLGLFAPRWIPAANLPAWIWPVGAAGMVLGAALRVWSLRALGRGFSRDVQVTQDQQLVTDGPYRWLRHPSYTGALLLFLGLGIAQANAVSILVLTVLPVTVYLWRIRVEEAALAQVLGDRYQSFAAGRARLVPWLYYRQAGGQPARASDLGQVEGEHPLGLDPGIHHPESRNDSHASGHRGQRQQHMPVRRAATCSALPTPASEVDAMKERGLRSP